AVMKIMQYIDLPFPLLAFFLQFVPLFIRDFVYENIADNRYNLFGHPYAFLQRDHEDDLPDTVSKGYVMFKSSSTIPVQGTALLHLSITLTFLLLADVPLKCLNATSLTFTDEV
ncbi:DCC family protein - chloroplastic, partial [Striga hermonthica]